MKIIVLFFCDAVWIELRWFKLLRQWMKSLISVNDNYSEQLCCYSGYFHAVDEILYCDIQIRALYGYNVLVVLSKYL